MTWKSNRGTGHLSDASSRPGRRQALQSGAAMVLGAACLAGRARGATDETSGDASVAPAPGEDPGPDYRIQNGWAKQSVMAWCMKPLPMETLIPACAKMGLAGIEGIDPKFYPLMKQHGLAVSLVGSHGFEKGPVNPEYHPMCSAKLREAIDLAVKWNCKNVITFTGMREPGMATEQGTAHCVRLWKSVIGHAEDRGVNLVLEHLNSRDDSHPMKGHPGYFGDDVEHCVEMVRAVGSPNMKLLFDIYHVGVMNGDVIRRFRQHQDVIAHVHTAGVPGRGELDTTQELNYPAIIRAILDTGYDGYITQEFIPTWDDKLAALRHGVKVCDIPR